MKKIFGALLGIILIAIFCNFVGLAKAEDEFVESEFGNIQWLETKTTYSFDGVDVWRYEGKEYSSFKEIIHKIVEEREKPMVAKKLYVTEESIKIVCEEMSFFVEINEDTKMYFNGIEEIR